MKKLIVLVVVLLFVGWGHASAQPKLCSMSPAYRAIYEYPTGTYWQKQIAKFPVYYATNNAYYQTKYGC